ncbi:MAG: hypothetical protein LBK58_02015 [Prevotellaceae bacterium]|jgi:hypothetical protein|nr:hypothetical protein [Prevotellaceae bacterium]
METIIEIIKNIPDNLKRNTIVYFYDHVLNDFCIIRWIKFRLGIEPEIYKRARDLIKLRKIKDDVSKINSFNYSSSELKKELSKITDNNTKELHITENEKYIDLAFYLKLTEKLIRKENRRFILTTVISILAIIGGIIGAIIGATIGKEGLVKLFDIIKSWISN